RWDQANQRRGNQSPASPAVAPVPPAATLPPRRRGARSTRAVSLDHLVGSHLESQWNCKPKRFGGFEVYHEFKLGRLHDRQVGRLFALENPAGVDTGLPPSIKIVRRIAYKTADCHGRAQGVNRWHGMAGRQRDDLRGIGKKRNGAAHHERVSPLLNKLRKRRLELARATCIHEQEVNSTSTRGSLQFSPFALSKNGVGRVAEVSDRLGRRHQFEQQLKALSSQFGQHEVDAGDISARSVETIDEANPDRVGSLHTNDRDSFGRRFGCECTLCAFQDNDHGYLTANQFGGQRWQQIVFTMCPSVFDREVLPLDVTAVTQALVKSGKKLGCQFERCKVEKPDHRHRRLLPARRERPRRRRSANERDEVASFHSITSSARASTDDGISSPSAILKLITSSY